MSGTAERPLLRPDNTPELPIPKTVMGIDTDRLRQFLAGTATMPSETLRIGGMLASPVHTYRSLTDKDYHGEANPVAATLTGAGDAWNNIVNKSLGIGHDPSLLDETGDAVARIAGGAIVGGGSATVRAGFQSLPTVVRAGARVLEALTPGTITNATTRAGKSAAVAANIGAQTAAGIGVEKATEHHDPTRAYEVRDEHGNVIESFTPAPGVEPGAGRVAANAVQKAVGEHPVAAGAGALGLAALAYLGHRGLRNSRVIREVSETSDVVQPKDRASGDVPIIQADPNANWIRRQATNVRAGLNKFADTVQDSNTLVKDALRQSDPNGYSAARDAIDATTEGAHKDRLINFLRTGRMETPRGTVQMERTVGNEQVPDSIHRLAEDIAHASNNDPEIKKRVNDLLAMESEADSRAYAHNKMATMTPQERAEFMVNIDRRTGQRIDPNSPPPAQFIDQVVPRATLPHIDDHELARRINAERLQNDRTVLDFADRYHAIHAKAADAWVDFGLLSKAERNLWRKANPNYMHMINLDDPKSPRTFKIREHGTIEHAGDPFLSSAEYFDFMMSHAYRNRMRGNIVETLMKGAGGPYGNGKWIGRVADPWVLRRTQITDPVTGQLRYMNKGDVTLTGDVRHYYKNGEKVDFEVLNKPVLNTLDKMPKFGQSLANWMRSTAQSATTGKIATLVGQPFTVANSVMGAMFAPLTRPLGRPVGMIDKGVHKLSGGRFGARTAIIDPTYYGGMLRTGVTNTASVLSRALSDSIKNSFAEGGVLSRLPRAKQIGDYAGRKYVESIYHEQHGSGAGVASTLGERDFDTPGNRATVFGEVGPHYNAARAVSDPQSLLEEIQLWKQRVTPADVKIAVQTLNEINEIWANLAQSYIYRSNRGKLSKLDAAAKPIEAAWRTEIENARRAEAGAQYYRDQAAAAQAAGHLQQVAPWMRLAKQQDQVAANYYARAEPHRAAADRAREEWFREMQSLSVMTRQLLGDPSLQGSAVRDFGSPNQGKLARTAGWWIGATPYLNIGLQATARLIRAMKENPAGTLTAIAATASPLALIGIRSAIEYDKWLESQGLPPEAVKNEMGLPSLHQTRFIRIYIPGVPIDQQPRVRIDPLVSLPYTIAREFYVRVWGLLGDPKSDPTLGARREHILELSQERSWNNVKTALQNAQPMNQLPPIIGAGLAALGIENTPLDQMVTRGGAQTIPTHGMGGFDQSKISHDVITRWLDNAAGQIGGAAATVTIEAVRAGMQSERRAPGTFVQRAAQQFIGTGEDRLGEFAPLWGHAQRYATGDFLAQATNARERTLSNIQQNLAVLTSPGTIGVGKYRQDAGEGGGLQAVDDPKMREVMSKAAAFRTSINDLIDRRTTLRHGIINTQQRGLPFADERNEMNRYSKEITRTNAELLAKMVDFEDRLSKEYGRTIRLDRLDPTKPITQFEPRQ